ncbi:MAG: TetR/AcrR family transcriptional regulator [Pseudoxanthomonas sp.]
MSQPDPAPPQDAGRHPTAGPGRPKDLAKRTAILAAAKLLFTREGFAGVSMDRIAAEAGVSKLTVYSHFGDKETLFYEAIRERCQELLPDSLFADQGQGPLRERLLHIARAFFDLASSDEAVQTHRLMMAPGHADAALRRVFWEAGPQRTSEFFGTLLQGRMASGELDIADVHTASQQFFTLLKGEIYSMRMCGLCEQLTPADAHRHIEASVDMFLRAYGRR